MFATNGEQRKHKGLLVHECRQGIQVKQDSTLSQTHKQGWKALVEEFVISVRKGDSASTAS